MLCGISTSFPMLFPSQRQVAHALLTRPPLAFNKSKLSYQPVRLECVRHAASVHPEPGSNSLKNCILTNSFELLKIFLRSLNCSLLLVSGLYYSQESIKTVQEWFLSKSSLTLCTSLFLTVFVCLIVVQFSRSDVVRSLAATCLLYHIFSHLSRVFSKFLKNFFNRSFKRFYSVTALS